MLRPPHARGWRHVGQSSQKYQHLWLLLKGWLGVTVPFNNDHSSFAADISTIFAQASGAGRAGVAVVRISGPRVPDILKKIAGVLPPPRVATLASLKNPLSRRFFTNLCVPIYCGIDCN
ncbi:MAG: hypothetical protein EBZ69_03890 [Alphaproteobacteria bacterium]|nr:hypothetical protein [Alphaproteobacteria bacterium]